MKNKTLLSLILIGSSVAMLSASEPPTRVEFVRPLGMGGAFTAIADDHNIFSFNPAGLVQRTGSQFTLLEIAGGVAKDTLDVVDFIQDNEQSFDNWGDDPAADAEVTDKIINDISKKDPRVYAAANIFTYLSGPVFWGAHIGLGVQGVVDSSFRLEPGVTAPSITYSVNNDIVVPLTIARRWETGIGQLGLGLTGKLMRRNKTEQNRVSVLQLDDVETPPIAQGTGFGGDLGLLYQPTKRTNVGMMIQDIGGTKLHFDAEPAKNGFQGYDERDSVIRPQTNLGAAITPQTLLWLLPTGDRWIFALDVRDIFNEEDHVLFAEGFDQILGDDLGRHVHMGTEFRYSFLRFRGGAYQGYPTAGLGIDIPLLKLDFAYYGREIGTNAGDRRQDNYVASIAIAFGSGQVEARERITKSKEMSKRQTLGEPTPTETAPTPDAEPEVKPETTSPAPATNEVPQ